jgi:hypothetical protein
MPLAGHLDNPVRFPLTKHSSRRMSTCLPCTSLRIPPTTMSTTPHSPGLEAVPEPPSAILLGLVALAFAELAARASYSSRSMSLPLAGSHHRSGAQGSLELAVAHARQAGPSDASRGRPDSPPRTRRRGSAPARRLKLRGCRASPCSTLPERARAVVPELADFRLDRVVAAKSFGRSASPSRPASASTATASFRR